MTWDKTALAEFIVRNEGSLLAFCRRLGVQSSDLYDYLQDLYITLLEHELENQGEGRLLCYCRRVLVNRVATVRRKEGRVYSNCVTETQTDNSPEGCTRLLEEERREHVENALNALNQRSRAILNAALDGTRTHEIAYEHHVSEENVRAIKSRALRKLAEDANLRRLWQNRDCYE